MLDRNAALGQAARNQDGAMTVERLLLGAHQAECCALATFDEPVEGGFEARLLGQRLVAAAALRPAAQRRLVKVVDSGLGPPLLPPLLREPRKAARPWHRAHIDQQR